MSARLQRSISGYGWRKSLPGTLGPKMTLCHPTTLPQEADLRPKCPGVYDQGDFGSCVDNAIAFLIQFDLMKEGKPSYIPARLYQYFNARFIENDTNVDGGSTVSDGLLGVQEDGVIPETMWPYTASNLLRRPPPRLYTLGKKNIPKKCAHLNQDRMTLRSSLAGGNPIAGGFPVYESFEAADMWVNGVMPIPDPNNEQLLGGHCVALVGYLANGNYIGRNSWGASWELAGYFEIPAELVENPDYFSDFVAVPLV